VGLKGATQPPSFTVIAYRCPFVLCCAK